MESKHDVMFMEILREEKNIMGFLDACFGFLNRCTDFYIESSPTGGLGFPPGVSEQVVLSLFRKWQKIKKESEAALRSGNGEAPTATEEVTISSDNSTDANSTDDSCGKSAKQEAKAVKNKSKPTQLDSYNGASYEHYSWSQSISDLEVIVKLPPEVRTCKNVLVNLSDEQLEVSVPPANPGENCKPIVRGRFAFKIKSSESYWCLEPGKQINFQIEKKQERWWDCLLDDEPRIQLDKIDCTRSLEDMGETEQMKIEELMWNQKRKLLGQPTSEQTRTEQMLKQAWNADGSPFKGTEYDPSILKFN